MQISQPQPESKFEFFIYFQVAFDLFLFIFSLFLSSQNSTSFVLTNSDENEKKKKRTKNNKGGCDWQICWDAGVKRNVLEHARVSFAIFTFHACGSTNPSITARNYFFRSLFFLFSLQIVPEMTSTRRSETTHTSNVILGTGKVGLVCGCLGQQGLQGRLLPRKPFLRVFRRFSQKLHLALARFYLCVCMYMCVCIFPQ